MAQKNIFSLALKAFLHEIKPNIALAAALAFMIVLCTGSLSVGSSVKKSLQENSLSRLGSVKTVVAISPPFSEQKIFAFSSQNIAFTYRLPVSARTTSGKSNALNLYACTPEFYKLLSLTPGKIYLNQTAGKALDIQVDKEFYLSVRKDLNGPALLTAGQADLQNVSLAVSVDEIIPDNGPGGFTEVISQQAPKNIFLPADFFFKNTELDPVFNLCVSDQMQNGSLAELLKNGITAQDLDWKETITPEGPIQITHKDLFFNPPATESVQTIFSWFLLEASYENKLSPFLFTAGIQDGPQKNTIWINRVLADDLNVKPGDELNFKYYVPGQNGELETRESSRLIEKIIPMQGLGADPLLMLAIPGFTESKSCSSWDTGFEIDLAKVRAQDEEYWRQYGGSPKIIFDYSDAVSLFPNPWGRVTAIRFPVTMDVETTRATADSLLSDYVRSFSLSERYPVEEAIRAASQGMDFGSLLFGLSFFIFVSVIIMAGVLVKLRFQSRKKHVKLFEAWGSRNSSVLFLEGLQMTFVLACAFIGILILTPLYSYGILAALSSVWKEAVASASLRINVDWITVISLSLIMLAIFLLTYGLIFSVKIRSIQRKKKLQKGRPVFAAVMMVLPVLILIVILHIKDLKLYGYFISSFLILTIFLAAMNFILIVLARYLMKIFSVHPWILTMIRRRKTILLATGILAFSVFSIGAVSGYFQKLEKNSQAAMAGTGGWDYWVQTALPSAFDPATQAGAQRSKIKLGIKTKVSGIHVLRGDEAGCLNLNRAFLPSIAGVDTVAMSQEDQFEFSDLGGKLSSADVWASLRKTDPDGTISVVAGAETLAWSLYLKPGDTIDYPFSDGRTLKLKIIAALSVSIFESYLVTDRVLMESLKMTSSDFDLFLIRDRDLNVEGINQAFDLYGPETTSTIDRVNSYLGLQNSYLLIFAVLGLAGLFLGTLALALLTARDVLGRRDEIFVFQARGVPNAQLVFFMAFPFLAALLFGLLGGIIAVLAASSLYASFIKSTLAPDVFASLIALIWVAGSAAIFMSARMVLRTFSLKKTGYNEKA